MIVLTRKRIYRTDNTRGIKRTVRKRKVTFYIGFDATADSLTAGHFFNDHGNDAYAESRTSSNCSF